MLPKKHRLKKKKDIEKVFRKGRVFKNDSLILKTIRNDLDYSRVSCLVSKKNSKKAVIRNKIKRRVMGAVGLDFKKIKKGFDAIFIARQGLENKESKEIKIIVNKMLETAGLFL